MTGNAPLPLVSIVVPTYNYSQFLREAIDSILAQDYPHVELIVLNDGSTDDTEKVLRGYPAGRFLWETQANMGQPATLNRGWAMSRGALLSYLNADDVLRPSAVSRLVESLARRPDVAVVYSDFDLISSTSQVVRHCKTAEFDYRRMVVQGSNCQPGPLPLIRREALDAAGPWDPTLQQVPDYDFWLRLGLSGTMLRIPGPLTGYRIHSQSLTYMPRSAAACDEPIRVLSRYFERNDLPPAIMREKALAMSNAYLWAMQNHLRAGRRATAVRMASHALRTCPLNVLSPHTTHVFLSVLFGRLRLALARLAGVGTVAH